MTCTLYVAGHGECSSESIQIRVYIILAISFGFGCNVLYLSYKPAFPQYMQLVRRLSQINFQATHEVIILLFFLLDGYRDRRDDSAIPDHNVGIVSSSTMKALSLHAF